MRGRGGYEEAAHLYDLFASEDSLDFFCHYGAEAGEILDVGAGTGRIAIRMARRGVDVYCVEPSPAMRGEFEKKLLAQPELERYIKLVDGEATSFDFGRKFPAAILSGSFEHLLDDEERLAALKNIGRHLRPGGVLVLDVSLGLMGDAPLTAAGVAQDKAREIRRFVGGRLLPGRKKEVLLVFETYEDGVLVERIEERSLIAVTSPDDVRRLLRSTGFEVRREFRDYHFEPFRVGDELVVVEAVRRERRGV